MAKKDKLVDPEEEMTFLEHIEEFRWHIVRSLLAAMLFIVIAFANYHFIFDKIIMAPKMPDFFTNRMFAKLGEWLQLNFGIDRANLIINDKPLQVINIDMAGQFSTHIWVSVYAGLIIASPYIFWELWRFLKPALYQHERRVASGAVIYTSVLFILGVLFGFYMIAPLSIHFLNSYDISDQILNQINLKSYISTVTSVTLASGVIFELPILVLFLSKVGLLTPVFMRKYRKHAYIVLLTISAIITPPDVFSQIMVCIPLVGLYEISVFISRYVEKIKKNKSDEALG